LNNKGNLQKAAKSWYERYMSNETYRRNPVLAKGDFSMAARELDGRQFCELLRTDAAGAAHYIDQCVTSPEKGSITEGMALWHTARLVLEAMSIDYRLANTEIPAQRGLRDMAQRAGKETLYDIHAAMWFLRPWAPDIERYSEWTRMLSYDEMTAENWQEMAEQSPHAIEAWHSWLTYEYSEAALYAVAAARLSEKLTTILEPGETP
jgi:hypothetical protein